MMIEREDGGNPPAPIAESWGRIEAWIGAHLPILKLTLRPGASKKDLAKFEEQIGCPLPDDVRESWSIRDGQRTIPDLLDDSDYDVEEADDLLTKGVIFGCPLLPLVSKKACLASRTALAHWQSWAEMVDDAEQGKDRGMLAGLSEGSSSTPAGAIRPLYANRGWIPLVEVDDSNYIGVDLDPGPDGVVGQVINFGRDEEKKYVLAPNWAQFLEDVACELESGNFEIGDDGDEKIFGMKGPRSGSIARNYAAWSGAKLPGGFPRG